MEQSGFPILTGAAMRRAVARFVGLLGIACNRKSVGIMEGRSLHSSRKMSRIVDPAGEML
jgi:hypothetical protein